MLLSLFLWCLIAKTHLLSRQQDSQEFLRFLIEGLHEDVNKVTGKRKYPMPDFDSIRYLQFTFAVKFHYFCRTSINSITVAT